MSHIFISYAAEDTAIVTDIAIGLKSAGYATWYYENDVVSGISYVKQINQALDQCQAFLLVASPRSVGSDQVTKEVMNAFERGKLFFPVLVELRPSKLKQLQPEWRFAIGVTSMVVMGADGVPGCVTSIVNGLKALGIEPERPVSVSSSYTPTHIADKILATQSSMEGERKQVTVLFADVVDFTHISEQLDPEQVQDLIRECLSFVTEEIHRYEGTIGQFLGDGVMALFGAPIAHEDAPQRALYAALAIRDRLQVYADKLRKDSIAFSMRIGLNSGLVVVGRIGDDLTMEYTAIGDTVNLASRMESTAQPGTVQVAEDTYRLTRGYFEFKPLGEVKVKGKKELVKAYELVGIGTARTRLGADVVRGLTPFLGRQREIKHLRDCYNRVKEGQGQVIGIVGEPGVGKSRLALEFVKAIPREEYTYLEGGCLHYGKSIAYLPFLDILRGYFGFTKGDQESLAKAKMEEKIVELDEKLSVMQAPLQYIFSLKVEDEEYLKMEPQQRREKTFEAIKTLLVRESQNRPLVLAIEDLHWIDKTSDEFLTYFINGIANAHILLILLYRTDYTPVWVSKTYYSQIRLDQLPNDSSGDLVQAILEGGEVTADLRVFILARASGNPLFIEEFTHALVERGCIQKKDGHYVLTVKPSDIEVPDTIQGIIAARMDRLEANLKRTMQMASVIGRDFVYNILQTITGMKQELKAHMLSLQELEFIYEKSLFPELEYIFKHALTQEVAYNSLLLKRRREIHGKIGKAIEELYHDKVEEFCEALAHHYSMAEDWEKAYKYLKLSGAKATKNYAKWEALAFYQGAIDLLKKQLDTEDNKRKGIEIRLLMSTPMRYLVYPEGSLLVLQEGERLCRELGEGKSLAQFLSLLSLYYGFKGDSLCGLKYAEDCFREAEKAQDIDLMAPIGFQLCVNYSSLGEKWKVAEMAPSVIALIESTERQLASFGWGFNLYAVLLSFCGESVAHLGDFQRGEALCEKGLRFAQDIKDLHAIAFVETMYATVYLRRGDGGKTIAHAENAIKHCEETQFVTILGMAWKFSGWGYLFLGDLETAREHMERGHAHDRAVGMSVLALVYYQFMSQICIESGDWERARGYAEEGLESAKTHIERHNEGWLRFSLGTALAKADSSQSAKAEKLILEGIELVEELKVKPYAAQGHLALGELYADMGQKEKALGALKKAQSMFREMGMDYWLRKTQNALEAIKG